MESGETEDRLDEDLEWAQRTLCRDESCIGVIGPDGRCKECGLPYESSPQAADSARSPDADRSETEPSEPDEPAPQDDWASRTLCSDGACIGVIGPDGRCKECGRPYSGPAEDE